MSRTARGQAASEYVVLLGIAIVMMLIVTTLLGGFGGTLSETAISESAIYWHDTARPFSILGSGQAGSVLYLSLANQGNDHLFLRQIIIDGNTSDLGAGWSWKAGRAKNISIPVGRACGVNGYDAYSYNVSFIYDTSLLQGYRESSEKLLLGYCS